MRKPNGYGSVKKLTGNRRRPFVFLVSKEGKQKPLAYFATQTEAEIYAADYNKKHNNKILSGHEFTFAELYYRWLPFHIDKYQPSKSTINSYRNSYKHCLQLQEMPLKNIKYRTLWNRLMKIINAKHSTHDCRHTCATLLDNAEANENAKRRILGHATGDVTDTVYTHKNLKQLRKAINKIK